MKVNILLKIFENLFVESQKGVYHSFGGYQVICITYRTHLQIMSYFPLFNIIELKWCY